jgi:hypothetical protein
VIVSHCTIDCRLNYLQITLSVASSRFCLVIRYVQLGMKYVTMIRSSLRVSSLKNSSYTVQIIATRTNSMSWNNGLCNYFEYLPLIIIILENNSYELNLSATESALMIIPHYRPMPSHDPKAFRVGDANSTQCHS